MNSLNLNVSGLAKSATLSIHEDYRAMKAEGRRVYNFGLGQSPFPVPAPLQDALRDHAHEKDYLPVEGLPELRDAVARYHSRTTGASYDADRVLVGPGSKELMFLIQLVYYGDLVIPIPSWVSYAPQARIIGRHVRWLPTHARDDWMLSPETLEEHCRQDPDRPRLVILNAPSNPTGTTFHERQLDALAEVARRYDLLLLSDEIYGELHHSGKHVSMARYYPEGTIISGGLSKWCGAGGWRLGYFVFPERYEKLQQGMAVAASETFTSTSAPIQYAAVEAFRGRPELEGYLSGCRAVLGMLGGHATAVLRSVGLEVPEPAGAFYLFPDFSGHREALRRKGIETGADLCRHLLERTGVAALPGEAFGCDPEQLSLRLAYVDFDGGQALESYERFRPLSQNEEAFLAECCPRVLEGVEELAAEVRSW